MENWLARTALLIGEENTARLAGARGAVLGLGGVGSAAAEALCRAGVGHLLLVDHDTVDETNLNRQLVATRDAVGMRKADAELRRLGSIRPAGDFTAAYEFYLPDNSGFLFDWRPDFVLDCIDTVTAKLHLAEACARRGVPLYMCLGTGNRLDPGALRIGDIADTAGCGCGLARVMRRELKRRGVARQTVLYSVEEPAKAVCPGEHGRHAPGSIAFVPPAAGFLLASRAVRDLLGL
ncbi:ThiF family adenylyltransferase [Anaerotruncus sp. DFI.9.16]|uniref:tRNA threonylcarbamoyladenosine dehydratase n=1 Tax=Anaerotruncus sp. DFI.9.16 TaxID=2965275 RepID=UPI0021096AB9|nr:tRNA threonylcarbamoyladenosine dehydratase [Anaerotruncus sp. DFI.9.16]MCQ4897180.1 tRNA threonylcarbamoyladenosine dehydratase [Anaerotruncus sp. DFI.9.16]